jgi:hypothetical protein
VQGYQSVARQGSNCGQFDSFNCDEGTAVNWANIFVQSLGPAGVDALIGKCGAVDQLFDAIVPGADCTTSSAAVSGLEVPGPGLPGGRLLPPILPPGLPNLPNVPGVPGLPNVPTGGLPTGGGGVNLPASTSGLHTNPFAPMPNHVGDLIISALYGWGGKA